MARSRNIKPGLFTNESVADCSFPARYLFTGLWTIADREGRIEDKPRTIKAKLLPMDDVDCDALLSELDRAGLVVRYEANGVKVLQVTNFAKHQRPHPSEPVSELPENITTKQEQVVKKNDNSGKNTATCASNPHPSSLIPHTSSPLPSASNLPTEGCSENGDAVSAEPETCVLKFPTDGKAGKHWSLTEAKVAEYQEAYPSLDVVGECRRALQWLRDNPTKRKTKGGMPAFLTRWLNKAQNSPSRPPPSDQRCRVPTDEELAAWTPT